MGYLNSNNNGHLLPIPPPETNTSVNDENPVNLWWNFSASDTITSMALSSDGRYLVIGSEDTNIYAFDLMSSTPLWSFSTGGAVKSVAISADGAYVVAGSTDYKVYLIHGYNSTLIWSYETQHTFSSANYGVHSVAISADGYYIAAANGYPEGYFFNRTSSSPIYTCRPYGFQYEYPEAVIFSVDITPDGTYTTWNSWSRMGIIEAFGIIIYDQTGSDVWYYGDLDTPEIPLIATSNDTSYIVGGSTGAYGSAEVLLLNTTPTGGLMWQYPLENQTVGGIKTVAISADGDYLVAGSAKVQGVGRFYLDEYGVDAGHRVYCFQKDSSIPLWSYFTGAGVNSIAISENGSYIVAGSNNGYVNLFHRSSPTPVWNYSTGAAVNFVAISPDGANIIGCSANNLLVFGPPITLNPPSLLPLTSPIQIGNVQLNWTEVTGSTVYYIYRANSPIISIDGINPIASASMNQYQDIILIPGLYYYVIVAGNPLANSSISNCENTTVFSPEPEWVENSDSIHDPNNPGTVFNQTPGFEAPLDTPIAYSATINTTNIETGKFYTIIISALDPEHHCFVAINSSVWLEAPFSVNITLELTITTPEVAPGTLITGYIYILDGLPSQHGKTIARISFSHLVI